MTAHNGEKLDKKLFYCYSEWVKKQISMFGNITTQTGLYFVQTTVVEGEISVQKYSNVEILHVLVFSLCDSKLHKCKTLFHNSSVI